MQKYDLNDASFKDNIQINNLNKLISTLASGKAVIITGPEHAVVATRICRNIDNPLEYKLYIYDSNKPNNETFIIIRKQKLNWLDGASNFNKDYELKCYDVNRVFVNTEINKPTGICFFIPK